MLPPPTVTVVIPTRNRPKELERALASVGRQTLRAIEVLIVDDGSDERAFDLYKSWQGADERYALLSPSVPGAPGTGPADTRNRGIVRARGEFVAFLDDDDEWIAADHLQVGVDAMRAVDADFFFANMQGYRDGVVTIDDWYSHASFLKKSPSVAGLPSIREVDTRQIAETLKRNSISANVMILRADLLRRVGGFLTHCWWGEDVNFAYRLADQARRVLFRAEVTARYNFAALQGSITVDQSVASRLLQQVGSLQHVRFTCRTAAVRNAARDVEAWIYRRLADESESRGEAVVWALQSLALSCGPASAATLAKVALRSASRRISK